MSRKTRAAIAAFIFLIVAIATIAFYNASSGQLSCAPGYRVSGYTYTGPGVKVPLCEKEDSR